MREGTVRGGGGGLQTSGAGRVLEQALGRIEAEAAAAGGGAPELRAVGQGYWLVRLLKGTGLSPAEVFWGWAATSERAQRLGLERLERGRCDLVVPLWREWGEEYLWAAREGRRREERGIPIRREQRVQRTLRALREVAAEELGEQLREEEVLGVGREGVRRVWQAVKTSYLGEGGYGTYHTDLAVLMLRGVLEGHLDLSYGRQCSWWERALEREGKGGGGGGRGAGGEGGGAEERRRSRGGKRGREEGWQRVVLDFGAGTQAGRREVERRGWLYVPLDREEWVWSQLEGGWVQNVVKDLRGLEVDRAWESVQEVVLEKLGLHLGGQLGRVVLWMSPPCRTFSRMDAVNVGRKENYRDHGVWCRPPVRGKRGALAREHDALVERWLAVAERWREQGAVWFLENPVGSLVRRPYFCRALKREGVRLREVHYCAYGRRGMKPTHILTGGSSWEPRRGRGGKCLGQGKCHAMVGRKHRASVAGRRAGERERPMGRGSKAARSAVPQLLWEEVLDSLG